MSAATPIASRTRGQKPAAPTPYRPRADGRVYRTPEIPTTWLPRSALAEFGVVEALVQSGHASSKAEARRGIQQNGFAVNGGPVGETDRRLGPSDLLAGGYLLLQKGRRNFALLAITD
jgi:tyrosyl-tRNA synthetase